MADLNEKLIACVLRHIEQHPQEYDQNTWCNLRDKEQDRNYCGTTACFAGWAVLLSTPVGQWGEPRRSAIRFMAQDLLGLDDYEASMLFAGTNTDNPQYNLSVIKSRLRSIRHGRGLPMDGPATAGKVSDNGRTE